MSTEKSKSSVFQSPALKPALPFIIGGSSGMIATTCIQPLDMIKTRIQLTQGSIKPTPITVVKDVLARGKITDLYDGLSAGLLRQVIYGTSRLGLFFTFEDVLKRRAETTPGATYGFKERGAAGLVAGGIGAMIGNPAEVCLIRMQSDGLLPPEKRANYRSVFDALARITRSEGVLGLWSGAYPTVIRAMALNFGQLAFFSESKHQIATRTSASETTQTVAASFIAGFFASAFSLPFDFVKSRLQSQRPAADGSLKYKGMLDCFVKVTREEGILKFYRGFGTFFMRIAPHT
jgi:solute carrier family 25 (mitochondrial oxoglutarate transporter), member 11